MPKTARRENRTSFGVPPKWRSSATPSLRILLLVGCAGLCVGGLTTPVARSQVEARPHIEYERRVDRGITELRGLSPEDRREVIRRVRDAFLPTNETLQERRRIVLDALSREDWNSSDRIESLSRGRTLFLDFKHDENGKISVGTRGAADYWLEEMELQSSAPTWHPLASAEELHQLLGDATTVVHQGDNLPEEWRKPLRLRDIYVRRSDTSPKSSWHEYMRAAQILNRPPQVGRVKILSALPQATDLIDSVFELRRMGMDVFESGGWRNVQKQMSQLQDKLRGKSESVLPEPTGKEGEFYRLFTLLNHYTIETATKKAFVEDLANGSNDYILLIAHFDGKRLYFPNGDTMTKEEFANIKRESAPERTLVLISCDTGTVNEPVESLGEIALRNKLAMNVVAPARKLSGAEVPDFLRSYLLEGKSINEVFVNQGSFNNISENLQAPRYTHEFWIDIRENLTAWDGLAQDG